MAQSASWQFESIALRDLSRRLGRDPHLVQASTGNTSIKLGNSLWIKASGKWLAGADADDFFVSVDLAAALEAFRKNRDIPETAVASGHGPPSIETAMHAVLPHRVVAHVHSVNTIAWAVRRDGPRQLRALLHDQAWQWIPYTPSGTALARKIHAAVSSLPRTNVLILENHGLVVCGDTCQEAGQLLDEVESRLAAAPRPAPPPDEALLVRAARDSNWSLPSCREIHALATDPVSRRILSGGVLYPCQAMFLPDTYLPGAYSPESYSPETYPPETHAPLSYSQSTILLLDGAGVLCGRHTTPAQMEILRGLAQVVQRIDALAPIRYLTGAEVSAVLNGPVYRESSNSPVAVADLQAR